MMTALTFVVLSLLAQITPAPVPQSPQPKATTPSACVQEIKDYVAAKNATLPQPAPGLALTAAQVSERSTALRQITADRLAMSQTCAKKFDLATTSDAEIASLVQLYLDASMPEQAKAATTRALAVKGQSPADRATTLSAAITSTLREPAGAERNARLEKMMDELDALPDTFIQQKINAHFALEIYYRYDDIDAGIIKHANWLMATAKTCEPALRKAIAPRVIGVYSNKAQALAGQGQNDEAIALLRQAPVDFPDVPDAAKMVQSEIERLQLVGTAGAPLVAPRWLNMPAGKTTLDLKGKVTLLEFSAHWCVPCKESYPGVNRLRAKYGAQGFQVVLATELWGYFQQERPLDAETEYQRDKTYFAEHGLDIPIAIGDKSPAVNPNDVNYKVGGIPQIHLVDKQGRIRLVMVGYDDANEEKLAKLIEQLLKEK